MPTPTKKSVFETMSAVDVSPYLFTKNGMSYLPWSRAIEQLKLKYPDADVQPVMYETERIITALVEKNADGTEKYASHVVKDSMLFTPEHGGCTVRTKLVIPSEGIEVEETLPVLDFKNKPVSPENVTADQVNKAIKRCGTKNIAIATGLGLSLWHKEEISESAKDQKVIDKLEGNEVIAKFKELVAKGFDKIKLANWCKENFGSSNPATIKNEEIRAKMLAALETLDIKDFQPDKKTK